MKKQIITLSALFLSVSAAYADTNTCALAGICNVTNAVQNNTLNNALAITAVSKSASTGTANKTPSNTSNKKVTATLASQAQNKQVRMQEKQRQVVQANQKTHTGGLLINGNTPSESGAGGLLSSVGGLLNGNTANILQIGSVIAQETGSEKTAKYLLAAGGVVGAADVAMDVMNGNADAAASVYKGVAAVGSIYAATSGDEDKVRDFGRGAAVIGGIGAYAAGDYNSTASALFGSSDASGKTGNSRGILNNGGTETGILGAVTNVMSSDTTQLLITAGAGIAAQNGKTDVARVLSGASAVGSGLEVYNAYSKTGRIDGINAIETVASVYGASSKNNGDITTANAVSGGANVIELMQKTQNGKLSGIESGAAIANEVIFKGSNNTTLNKVLNSTMKPDANTTLNNNSKATQTLFGTNPVAYPSSSSGITNTGAAKVADQTSWNNR